VWWPSTPDAAYFQRGAGAAGPVDGPKWTCGLHTRPHTRSPDCPWRGYLMRSTRQAGMSGRYGSPRREGLVAQVGGKVASSAHQRRVRRGCRGRCGFAPQTARVSERRTKETVSGRLKVHHRGAECLRMGPSGVGWSSLRRRSLPGCPHTVRPPCPIVSIKTDLRVHVSVDRLSPLKAPTGGG
jgi:hypothetical protein